MAGARIRERMTLGTPPMDAQQIATALVRYRKDFRAFAREQLKIASQPLQFWPCQTPLLEVVERQMADRGFVRTVWLKSRQVGASTFAQALIAWRTMLWPNVNAIVIADQAERSRTLFDIAKSFYEQMDEQIRPAGRYHTKRELVFANPSRVSGFKDPGLRSRIVIDSAHKKHIAIGCLHPETLVWGVGGLKRICDIEVGDSLVTHTGADGRVRTVIVRDVDNRAWTRVSFWTSEAPLICTSDHRVWTPSGWKPAGELRSGDWVVLPMRSLPEVRRRSIDFRPFHRKSSGPALRGNDEMELSHELGWVLGLYLAEGSLTGQANSSSWRSGVTFSLAFEEQSWVQRIERALSGWAKQVGVRLSEHESSCCVFVYNTWLARAFHEWFYSGNQVCRAWTKRVPPWVYEAPDEFIDGFLSGYFAGDGWIQNGRVNVSSASRQIAGQIRDLLLSRRFGLASISFRKGTFRPFPDGMRKTRGAWVLGLSGDGAQRIAEHVGWPFPKIPDTNRMWRWFGDSVLVKVRRAARTKSPMKMYDLEVDHMDHSYRTVGASVANSNWQIVHLSEAARFKDPAFVLDGVIPAVHRVPGTMVIMESSAEMAGTWYREFFEASQRGETAFEAVFVPWFLQPEYFICPVCHATFPKVCADPSHAEQGTRLMDLDGEERHIMTEYNLRPGHILWMREKLAEMGNDWNLFRQSFPLEPSDAWVTPGSQAFPPNALRELRKQIQPPARIADVHPGPQILDVPDGKLWIWDEPRAGKAYDIGVDPASGGGDSDSMITDDGLDWSVACVLERGSNKQVAEWRSKSIDAIELATVLYWLGMYYNIAQIAVETNGPGGPTNAQLSKLGFLNQYIWRYRDEIVPRYSRKTGWETNSKSKPWLVTFAIHEVTSARVIIRSELLFREMENYVQKGPREWGAAAGRKDDAVMAWMIALIASDDESFEKYFGLAKVMRAATRNGGVVIEKPSIPEEWECDRSFLKKSGMKVEVQPWS